MQIHSFIKFQIVLGVLFTHGFGEGQDVRIANISDIFCTSSSGWRDAMESCLGDGGKPLTHEEILTTSISEKIVFPVWTADYVVVSNWTNETSEYQPGRSICGYATITFLSRKSNFSFFNVTAVNYGNCTVRRPYICETELTSSPIITDSLPKAAQIIFKLFTDANLEISMDKMTWMDANTHCNTEKRHFVRKNRLGAKTYFAFVHPKVPESTELEVWIGSAAILDSSSIKNQIETDKVVMYGTFSFADGFRTTAFNQSNEFRALCGFESTKHVDETPLIDCLSDTPWLVFAITISGSVLFVFICGGVVIYVFYKRKRRRAKFSVDTTVSDTTAHSNVSRHGESNPTGNDHGEGYATANRQSFTERELAIDPPYDNNSTSAADPDYTLQQMADITVHDTMYDTTDSEKAKPAGDKVGFHIYDRAIYDHGELLYDNTC